MKLETYQQVKRQKTGQPDDDGSLVLWGGHIYKIHAKRLLRHVITLDNSDRVFIMIAGRGNRRC